MEANRTTMTCIPINNGFICLAKTDFKCPNCGKQYSDDNDKYFNRCNKNKSGYTVVKCSCKIKFGMTYDITVDSVSFKLKTK